MSWCGEKSEGIGVGVAESWGDIRVTQFGWLYASARWSLLPRFHPWKCWGDTYGETPREGGEGQAELAERDLEGCKYAIIKLKRRDKSRSQEVGQDTNTREKVKHMVNWWDLRIIAAGRE